MTSNPIPSPGPIADIQQLIFVLRSRKMLAQQFVHIVLDVSGVPSVPDEHS